MLAAIGETPVNSVDNTGLMEADMASAKLDETSRQVQTRGWDWNTLKNYTLDPDINGEIILPASTAKVDTSGSSRYLDLVQRGNRLYDRDRNTFVIGTAVQVSLTILLDFEDLPQAVRDFILLRASRRFQQKQFGSTELAAFDDADERQAWFDLLDAEADSEDNNMLRDSQSVSQILLRKHFNKD
jgi:hypothetical protein